MNSNYTWYDRSPSVRLSEAANCTFGGIRWLLCFVLSLLVSQANAQNLLVNGDFEGGSMAPWTGGELRENPSGGLLARVSDFQIGPSLGQTVATVIGQRYILAVELRNETQFGVEVSIIAQAQTGAIDVLTGALVAGTASQNFTVPFTASSTSTLIEFRASRTDVFLVDNVSLIAIAPSAAGRSYAGTMVTAVTVTDPPMSMKSSRKVTAQINDDGELTLLDGTEGIITGYLSSTGEFLLLLPEGKRVVGNAVIRGRRINLEYTSGSHAAVTASGAIVGNTIKRTLTLVRH